MDGSDPQIAIYLLAAGVFGVVIGWLIRSAHTKRRIEQLSDKSQAELAGSIHQRERLSKQISDLQLTINAHQAVVSHHETVIAQGRIEIESANEKAQLMTRNVFTLRAEREGFKVKISTFQNALNTVKRQTATLQAEFVKSAEFYKGELLKAFEKRKVLETKVENAALEHESLINLLQASRSEHESVNKIVASAEIRLGNLDALEQKVIELEAENAELGYDANKKRREIEALGRDVAELDELKIQNQELAQCIKSMETSRKQYEKDAKRYRDDAGQSEQQSETLRIKLDEVEKNFAEIERQQRQALEDVRDTVVAQESNDRPEPELPQLEVDDLQQIVGIGKVFEQMLHDLGITSYRQIAAFDVSDIARVNIELNERKGRMEQDDWIGQAKELLFKKYG